MLPMFNRGRIYADSLVFYVKAEKCVDVDFVFHATSNNRYRDKVLGISRDFLEVGLRGN